MEDTRKRKTEMSFASSDKKSKTEVDEKIDWEKELEEKGYCVVPNVISKEKANESVSKFWDWFEGFETGVDRNNPKTWTCSKLPFSLHGIFQHYSVGHEQFVWDLRCDENVIKVFSKIWGTEKLLVSFDGVNFSRPSNRSTKPWPHLDQGPKKLGKVCVQGFVNLLDSGENDGGLVVYEKSHLKHTSFFKDNNITTGGDWIKFKDDQIDYYKDCKPIKVCCKAGDMVLWDSRTVHYASQPHGDSYRMVVYVSMLPASRATQSQLKKKKSAFQNKRMTSHWAVPVKLFNKNPRTYGNDEIINKFKVSDKLPVLTERGKKLAGLIPY